MLVTKDILRDNAGDIIKSVKENDLFYVVVYVSRHKTKTTIYPDDKTVTLEEFKGISKKESAPTQI